MNSRIRELLKQAEARYPRHLAVAVPEVQLRQDALEKFAEFLIRDVLAQVEEIQRLDNVYKNKVGLDMHIDWQEEVLKNFGVK